MTQTEHIDPTGFGLLLVAAVSLIGALDCFCQASNLDIKNWDTSGVAAVIGMLLLIVAVLAYKANSTFGMTVFGLVGAGVLIVGGGNAFIGGATCGTAACFTFGILYLFCIPWSIWSKTPKLLTILLVTTALIFLVAGVNSLLDGGSSALKNMTYVLGVVYLLNFIFNFWLGTGLVSEGKVKYF